VEESYKFHGKCIKQNELQYKRQDYIELYKRISIIKERILQDSTVPNNSLWKAP